MWCAAHRRIQTHESTRKLAAGCRTARRDPIGHGEFHCGRWKCAFQVIVTGKSDPPTPAIEHRVVGVDVGSRPAVVPLLMGCRWLG